MSSEFNNCHVYRVEWYIHVTFTEDGNVYEQTQRKRLDYYDDESAALRKAAELITNDAAQQVTLRHRPPVPDWEDYNLDMEVQR